MFRRPKILDVPRMTVFWDGVKQFQDHIWIIMIYGSHKNLTVNYTTISKNSTFRIKEISWMYILSKKGAEKTSVLSIFKKRYS